ncbi:tripartite motif-containing protein 64-like [Macrotis lagotis]|uniref:tripartite motif-containing protein 64-like n=1 Tax=Macrotis lagotis TaxID=92651 RepID=UPI003D693ED3
MAAAREILQKLQKEITCSICKSYFSQPVTIMCGHSFCQACLSLSWSVGAPVFSCPECRQVSQVTEYPVVSEHLAQLTDQCKQLIFQHFTEGQSHCATHNQVYKLFCEDDQTLLCVRCCRSPEHGAHKFAPVDEAAHNCRKKFQNIQSHLRKNLEEAEKVLAREEKSVVDWHWMITEEYRNMHRFLMEDETRCLQKINEEQRVSQERITQHMEIIQDFIAILQEAGHQHNLELLQQIKQLLGRSESVLSQKIKAVIPELREEPIPGIMEMLHRFRVDISMDATSTSPYLIVSKDCKSVKAGEAWQEQVKHFEVSTCHYVFADQAFSSGRQYWEVDVEEIPQWILGIYVPYMRNKRSRDMDSCAAMFVLQCLKKDEDYFFQSHPGSLNHRIKGPVPRVGVYLEHTPGTLIFYNVLQRSLIYKFHPISFTAPITPIFAPGPPLAERKAGAMTLCPLNHPLHACCSSSL